MSIHADSSGNVGGFGGNRIAPMHSSREVSYNYVTGETFQHALRVAQDENDHSVFVTVFSTKVYDKCSCYLSQDRCSGYAITADGMLISVFSWKGLKRGDELVADAVQRGAKLLECFDGYLATLYMRHGFQTGIREMFRDEFAPAGWNYERDGRPDYLTMFRK